MHDDQTVGQLHDLRQICRDQQHRNTGARQLDELFADEFRRADVNAARRLVGKNEHRIAGEFARDDDLLNVAAGEHTDLLLAGFAQNGVVLDQLVRLVVNGLHVEKRAMVQPLFRRTVGNEIFLDGRAARDAVEHTVFRDEGDALVAQLLLRKAEKILRLHRHRARVRRQEAEEHIDQLLLAVALDARNAENFTPAHVEGDLVEHLLVPLVDVFDVAHAQHNIRRLRLVLLHVQNDITADHQTRNFFLRYIASIVNTH